MDEEIEEKLDIKKSKSSLSLGKIKKDKKRKKKSKSKKKKKKSKIEEISQEEKFTHKKNVFSDTSLPNIEEKSFEETKFEQEIQSLICMFLKCTIF